MSTGSIQIDEASYKTVRDLLRSMRMDFPKRAIGNIQKSMTKVKALVVDNTYEVMNLTKTRITEDITVEVSGDNLDAFKIALRSSGKPIGLYQFVTNKTGYSWYNPKPINVKIYRAGATHVFHHGFIAPGKGGSGMHLWEREDRIGLIWDQDLNYWKLPHELRFPIQRMTTLRIQDIQGNDRFMSKVLAKGADIVIAGLKSEIDIALEEFAR